MKRLSLWLTRAVGISILVLLALPALVYAEGESPVMEHIGFAPSVQTWALILGAITPLATYVINYHAPWISEHVKGTVLVIVSGVVGAVWTAIQTHIFGFNDATVQLVLTAILGAFGAHALVYKPAGWNVRLGGGRNKP